MSGVEPIDPHPSASAVLARGSITSRDAVAPTKADRKTTQGDALGPFCLAARARTWCAEFRQNNQFQQFLKQIFVQHYHLHFPVIGGIIMPRGENND